MSFTAAMAATLAWYPREALSKSTMSSGRIDPRKSHVPVLIRIRMARHVAPFGVACVRHNLRDRDAARCIQLRVENRRERRLHGRTFENRVLPAVRPAFRRPRRLCIGQVLGQQFGPHPLGRHARSANGKHRKKAHEFLPSWMAERTIRIWLRIRFDAS